MLLAVCTLFLCPIADARVGESLDQLKKRWGEPKVIQTKIETKAYRFRNGLWVMGVVLHNGKAGYIEYVRLDRESGAPREITNFEVAAVLKLNGKGKEWKITDQDKGEIYYALPGNNDMWAVYDKSKVTLTVLSLAAGAKAATDAADKSVDGL